MRSGAIAWHIQERFTQTEDGLVCYVKEVYDRYRDVPEGTRYSIMSRLEVVAALFEDDGFDSLDNTEAPELTPFMVGACAAFDVLSMEAAEQGVRDTDCLAAWADSEGFLPIVRIDMTQYDPVKRYDALVTATQSVAKARLMEIKPPYAKLLVSLGRAVINEGLILPEQLPSLNHGFAFALGGSQLALELLCLDLEDGDKVSEEELARWLAD